MIRMHVGVDDIADGSWGKFANLGHDLLRQRGELRVHDQHAFAAHLDRDVTAGARQHVDVVLHRLDMDFDFIEILLLAVGRCRPKPIEETRRE